jgi:hypothetical protein
MVNQKLKAQAPAEGILLRKDYGDAKVYQVVCECGDCDHSHNVWVEAEDIGVSVTIYTQQSGGPLIDGKLFGYCLLKGM